MRKTLPGAQNLPALPRESGVVLWWKRVFKGEADIDVARIPDRKTRDHALQKHQQVTLD